MANDLSHRPTKPTGGGWDWENTWFNPYQSEYVARKKKAEARAAYDKLPVTQTSLVSFKGAPPINLAQSYMANYQPSANETAMSFQDLMDAVGGSSDGGGGGGGISSQQIADSIRKSYEGQIQNLGTNRTNAANLIQQFANQFKTNLQPISQQFQGATQASVGEIARRAAQGQADAANLAKELSGSLTGLGVNAQPLQQQANINAQQAAQGSQYERDFTNRLAQIAAMNDANALTNNELVRQGAAGTLEQNYSQMLSALQNARDQEILNAQNASYGGGGGGGGGSDPLDQVTKYLKAQQLFGEVMGGGTDYTNLQSLMSAAAKKDPAGFFAGVIGMTPEQRQSLGIE
jgi:hypothetical protein